MFEKTRHKKIAITLGVAIVAFVWHDLNSDDDVQNRNGDARGVNNAGWVASRDQTPPVLPKPSQLVNWPWQSNGTCEVSAEDVEQFERHGYVLLRNILDPKALDFMNEEATVICKKQLKDRGICQIEQLRWQVNTFRDFMFYSQLGCYADKLIRGNGVRITTEALFGAQWNLVDPYFFSYGFHLDTPGQHAGRYHGYTSRTKGASAWFPFHDLDDQVTGGSIEIQHGYPTHNDCRFRACGGMIYPSKFDERQFNCSGCHLWVPEIRTFKFNKGDVLYWHPDMPHKTQRVRQYGFTRHSFTVRLIDGDGDLCSVAMACGDWMGCCRDIPLRDKTFKPHSHCWPQIYPNVLDHEVAAHYSDEPKHLMGDLAWNDKVHTIPSDPNCI